MKTKGTTKAHTPDDSRITNLESQIAALLLRLAALEARPYWPYVITTPPVFPTLPYTVTCGATAGTITDHNCTE